MGQTVLCGDRVRREGLELLLPNACLKWAGGAGALGMGGSENGRRGIPAQLSWPAGQARRLVRATWVSSREEIKVQHELGAGRLQDGLEGRVSMK